MSASPYSVRCGAAAVWDLQLARQAGSRGNMPNRNDRLPELTGDIDRLRALFADAFGADVLPELSFRLRALRHHRVVGARERTYAAHPRRWLRT